ncbi:MAG TPA: M20/M25/M40 family metallo-hydrolase [Phycisphaerales bacterium]|nr:M20/M25/M40 family metallo-hydrolase [Phycisphaerales bacterium]
MAVDNVLSWLKNNEGASVERLVDWLRIKSISTDPQYKDHCVSAAQWAAERLEECGFSAKVIPTGDPANPGDLSKGGGHPIVLAHNEGDPGYKGPHVLFYGHYDVQPVDPLNLWESDPFEPVIRDARKGEPGGRRVVARGAVDDKGQVITFLEAMRAWKEATGKAAGGVKFTVLLEGEEETGSVNLETFVRAHKKTLEKCDVCLISDTGMLGRGKPAITYGVRGLAYTEVVLHASNQDLHSGLWGGRCPNPITELARVLAQLHDKKRRVTIPGFYDDVVPLTKQERANWKALKFNAKAALKQIGLPPAADIGEAGFTAMEREWGRPTAEINGIIGGYTGKGAKTVIAAHASAKVSFRLVANQDPKKITKQFFKWCKDRTPPGCRWELIDHHGGLGVTTPIDSPSMQAASRALKRASGKNASLIKSGGSIPVAGMLKGVLGIDTIFMGFGLDDDRVHSPNEKFEIDCLNLGARAHAVFVDELMKG